MIGAEHAMSRAIRSAPSAAASSSAALALAAGAVVAVVLGVYGSVHDPTGRTLTTLGFSSLLAMKVWLAVAAGVLALAQGITAAWMYGLLGRARSAPGFVGPLHRATGALAVLVTLPVAYSCLWSLGFQTYDTRVLLHSLVGCLLYGALVTKVLVLHGRPTPGWLLPAAGGAVLTSLVLVVLTSAVWYLGAEGVPTSAGY
jgi:hypothetical protein